MAPAGWLFAALSLCGVFLAAARGRAVLAAVARAPIGIGMPFFLLILFTHTEQMRGMMTATLGGYNSEGHYNEAAWHQVALPIAVFLLGLQGWFWTQVALNAAAFRSDTTIHALPAGDRWATWLTLCMPVLLGVFLMELQPWDRRADYIRNRMLHTASEGGYLNDRLLANEAINAVFVACIDAP